jgi:DNA repair exonuclease SbcCD ATPase subunit
MNTITLYLNALEKAYNKCDTLLKTHKDGDDFDDLNANVKCCNEKLLKTSMCYNKIKSKYLRLQAKNNELNNTLARLIKEDAFKKEAARIEAQRAEYNAMYAEQYNSVFTQINTNLAVLQDKMDNVKYAFKSGDISYKCCKKKMAEIANKMNNCVSTEYEDVKLILEARQHCAHDLHQHHIGCYYYMNDNKDETLPLFDLCYTFGAPNYYIECVYECEYKDELNDFYECTSHMNPSPKCGRNAHTHMWSDWLICNKCKYVTYNKCAECQ